MTGIVRPLWFEPVRHCYRLVKDPCYRTLCLLEAKLGNAPRFVPGSLKLHGKKFRFPDAASFLSAYREIFVERIYAFPSDDGAPGILDLGANIGLSVLYFKQLFPAAKITAYEADPEIFAYLEGNIRESGCTGVELINKAAWHEDARLRFHSEGADGGRVASGDGGGVVEVQAVNLAHVLRGRSFRFVKMDIEGAEESVLPACGSCLDGVRFIFVEYHSPVGRRQGLDRILAVLADAGFRVSLQNVSSPRSPFMGVGEQGGFDLQVNIFGWRE